MEQKNQTIKGKMCIVALRKKETGANIIALGCDLGYTVKLLNFTTQDIAELLDVTPRTLAQLYHYAPDGQRQIFPLDVEA